MNYNMIVPIRQVAAAMNTAIFTDFVPFNKWYHNPLTLSVTIHNSFPMQTKANRPIIAAEHATYFISYIIDTKTGCFPFFYALFCMFV